MSNLLIGLLGVLMATNQAVAASNLVHQATGVSVAVSDPNDPLEKELKAIMDRDDAAEAESDRIIQDNDKFAAQGGGVPQAEVRRQIHAQLDPIRKAYLDFIARHPNHARARVAYASLLHDMNDEEGEIAQLEKAAVIDPTIPSIWNNMANYYGEHGPTEKAFQCYEKALTLDTNEPVYLQNFATTVYLFRPAARQYYHITEQQVFDKALALYEKAVRLDPTNFPLATDLAQSYYGIKPTRTEDALKAWTNALAIAHDDVEREGVYIHLARFKLNAGRFDEAREHLKAVTNAMYKDVKDRLTRNLTNREAEIKASNAPSSTLTTNSVPIGNIAQGTNAAAISPKK